MDYLDFYDIAKELNYMNGNAFTEREIAENAYNYKAEYDWSRKNGNPSRMMCELCYTLVEDMDKADYDFESADLDVATMERVLREFMEEI